MTIKFLLDNIHRFNIRISRNIGNDIRVFITAWISEIYCFIRFGCSPDDYFRYEFFRKSNYERDKFITYQRSQRVIKNYNDRNYIHLLQNKVEFNTVFSEYLKREWIDCRSTSEKQFRDFLARHGSVIMKPLEGGQGRGIFKLSNKEYQNGIIKKYRNYIAEEVLQQHSKMSLLNPSSVNTVRVLTFKGVIIGCALRIGVKGAFIDNLHSNGVCAHLDKDTGIIDAVCVDNDMNKYLFHPDSGIKLVGYQIPNWKVLLDTVKEASQKMKRLQYIGWDVAVLEDSVAIIEGNHDPGHDIMQMIAQTGLWNDILQNKERR